MDFVDLTLVFKQLRKVPKDVIKRLQRWVLYVETTGLLETRKIPGFHDEPLKGEWKGYRSVRLSRQWRVIYKHTTEGSIHIAKVEEISAHDY